MKVLSRILIILVVAVTIAGTMYSIVNAGAQTQLEQRPFRLGGEGIGERQLAERRGTEVSFSMPLGAIKNLAIIAFIVVIYLNLARGFSKWRSSTQGE